MITFSVFVVDDESTIRDGVSMALEGHFNVNAFPTAEKALDAMKLGCPDLVLMDIGLPGMNGIEALSEIKRLYPHTLVVMITAYEDIESVISSMKLGAHDYVVKPIHLDGLEVTIQNALQTIRLTKEVQALQEKYLKENVPCFVGESNAIQNTMEFIDKVAQSPDTPILIFGETGTGKELIAGAIHYRSPNFKGPFVPVNCAAIPRDLIESELFGYEKGAFSGARVSGKKGLIEEAEGGTLFLDEVGDLSLEAQAKLLRFLEEGEFYRVGETRKICVRTRVVSATNKDLQAMMDEGLFRKDLYFRLGVVSVHVPSLNQRRDDILPLARHFLYAFARKFGKSIADISVEAAQALLTFNYTGNVRELKNLVERGVLVVAGPQLTLEDLGMARLAEPIGGLPVSGAQAYPPIPPEGIDLPATQESMERFYLMEALRMAKGNESQAARLLNINHHTFRYRKKKLLLSPSP